MMMPMNRNNSRGRIALGAIAALAVGLGLVGPAPAQMSDVSAYKVGKILTMDQDDTVINNGVIIVRDGKIDSLGKARDITIPDGAKVVEMPQCWLVPGFVELHNHTGGSSMDLHDYVFLTNPDLRTIESVEPGTEDFKRARAGGVTTALLISGSGTNMSGLGTAFKFIDAPVKDAVVKFPASIKIAQAGNPERYWFGVGRAFMNYNLRNTLKEARAYDQAWTDYETGKSKDRPWFDPTYAAFRDLLGGKFIASVHTQIYQVVMSTVTMLDGEFNLKTVLDHSTFDGYKTATLVKEAGDIITINGPRQFYYDGTQRKIFGNASRWYLNGVRKLGINTDAPVIPQEELSYQATMACWYGLPRYAALVGLTRVGAEALMLEDQLGQLKPGMDADFAIWSGDPIDPRSVCWITVINGQVTRDVRDKMKRF